MNIMRKLRSGASTAPAETSPSSGGDSPPDSPHTQLGLMHLKKLFNEYTHPKEPFNESERDFKLYNMLPLFCKVPIQLTIPKTNTFFSYRRTFFKGIRINAFD